MYDLYEAEAQACLEKGLVLPAHDYVLRCSHTFNVLDTRGAVGVTERQAFFGRMRNLSRRVAEAYLEQRQRLEFPWLVEAVEGSRLQVEGSPNRVVHSNKQGYLQPETFQPATFLLEVGTEELPASDLDLCD
jgi:glycyl-tRNA synthetase